MNCSPYYGPHSVVSTCEYPTDQSSTSALLNDHKLGIKGKGSMCIRCFMRTRWISLAGFDLQKMKTLFGCPTQLWDHFVMDKKAVLINTIAEWSDILKISPDCQEQLCWSRCEWQTRLVRIKIAKAWKISFKLSENTLSEKMQGQTDMHVLWI